MEEKNLKKITMEEYKSLIKQGGKIEQLSEPIFSVKKYDLENEEQLMKHLRSSKPADANAYMVGKPREEVEDWYVYPVVFYKIT